MNVLFAMDLDHLISVIFHASFVDQTKQINISNSVCQLISDIMSTSLKYGVAVTVVQHEVNDNGQFAQWQIPVLTIQSKRYFKQLLDKAHDYLKMRLIEESAPRSQQTPEIFMNPTDIVLDEILSLLKQTEEKEEVRRWFRYDKNVFSV